MQNHFLLLIKLLITCIQTDEVTAQSMLIDEEEEEEEEEKEEGEEEEEEEKRCFPFKV